MVGAKPEVAKSYVGERVTRSEYFSVSTFGGRAMRNRGTVSQGSRENAKNDKNANALRVHTSHWLLHDPNLNLYGASAEGGHERRVKTKKRKTMIERLDENEISRF
jgi:hypothetical protein